MKQNIYRQDRSGVLSWLIKILVSIFRFTISCIGVLARYGTSPQTVAAYSAWSKPPVRITFLPNYEQRR
jgi:hypothetical protein